MGPCFRFVDDVVGGRRSLEEIKSAQVVPEPLKEVEYAGWLGEYLRSTVGTHPVFNFVRYPPPGYRFTDSGVNHISLSMLPRIFSMAKAVLRYSWRFHQNGVPAGFIWKYWTTRHFSRHYLKIRPGAGTLALYPTWLYMCPNHRWMVEIEDMLTLMSPFVSNGSYNPALTREHPLIKCMEVMLESDDCRGIICHLRATADGLKEIFKNNPAIPPKIYHIPLGMKPGRRIERRLPKSKKTINMLFLNGWAQDPKAAYRRGLLDSLQIFKRIGAEFEDVTLTIRSSLPELSKEYLEILADPRVTVLDQKIHQSKLEALYENSDILLFPAVRIAVTTLQQAMANSLAIVASDGFGIEEYISHGENGLIGKGFHGRSGHIDSDGFFREDYLLSLKANPEVVDSCVQNLRRLIQDDQYRIGLQNRGRDILEQRFNMENWNARLKEILDAQ